MKRRIISSFGLVALLALAAALLYPSARFTSVQRLLWPHKKEAMDIWGRLSRNRADSVSLTSEEERNGWTISPGPDSSRLVSKRLFVWSRLVLVAAKDGTFTWEYFPAPSVIEYLHVGPQTEPNKTPQTTTGSSAPDRV
jgi:hypothetical protein